MFANNPNTLSEQQLACRAGRRASKFIADSKAVISDYCTKHPDINDRDDLRNMRVLDLALAHPPAGVTDEAWQQMNQDEQVAAAAAALPIEQTAAPAAAPSIETEQMIPDLAIKDELPPYTPAYGTVAGAGRGHGMGLSRLREHATTLGLEHCQISCVENDFVVKVRLTSEKAARELLNQLAKDGK